MKRLIVTSLTIALVFLGFAYLILFEGSYKKTLDWWASKTRDNPSMPYSPYKVRIEDSKFLRTEDANVVEFRDKHLFWKGSGAIALPELTVSGKLVSLIMKSGGSGYSNKVQAFVSGSMGNIFKLGSISVENGEITGLEVIKSGVWNSSPKVFWGEEKIPFTGTAENRFANGQLMTRDKYLSGMLHGKSEAYTEIGIPIYSKEYNRDLKQGTHIYWYKQPFDPESYVQINRQTLWSKLNEEAKKEFGIQFGKDDSNKWLIDKYKRLGGTFQVRLLEHWEKNQKHGLFEGFDRFGNKTFKDEFKYGLRIKHRTFDKTKTKSFDRKVE